MTTAAEFCVDVSARACALAWLNAFLAAAKDDSRPQLCQTLALELFDAGVQMVAMNGAMLLRTWVPANDGGAWPEIDEAPERRVVVMDTEGFGAGFMRVLLRLTADETHAMDRLNVSVTPHDDGATLLLGEEFMTERLSLRASGQRIDLRLFEGDYPNWRDLYRRGKTDDRTEIIRVDTQYFAIVGKLKEVMHVDLVFGGEEKAIWLKAGVTDTPLVLGILMPLRRSA